LQFTPHSLLHFVINENSYCSGLTSRVARVLSCAQVLQAMSFALSE